MMSQPVHNSIKFQSLIPLGMPGCELRFAETVFNMGYIVLNSSLDIKNVHMHIGPARHEDKNRLYGTYLFTPPCRLSDVKSASIDRSHLPMPVYLPSFVNQPIKIG